MKSRASGVQLSTETDESTTFHPKPTDPPKLVPIAMATIRQNSKESIRKELNKQSLIELTGRTVPAPEERSALVN